MSSVLPELNHWAWLSFFFLFLSAICTALASKKSTTTIVKSTINDPLIDLTEYLVSNHNDLVNDFFNNMDIYNAGYALKRGDIKMSDNSWIDPKSLNENLSEGQKSVFKMGNKLHDSEDMIRRLSRKITNSKVIDSRDQYFSILNEVNDNKINIHAGKVDYHYLNRLIGRCRGAQISFLNSVLEAKVN